MTPQEKKAAAQNYLNFLENQEFCEGLIKLNPGQLRSLISTLAVE
jgi:hypothetical protein